MTTASSSGAELPFVFTSAAMACPAPWSIVMDAENPPVPPLWKSSPSMMIQASPPAGWPSGQRLAALTAEAGSLAGQGGDRFGHTHVAALPGGGHPPMADDPEAVTAVIIESAGRAVAKNRDPCAA